jgi:hypothetical protein
MFNPIPKLGTDPFLFTNCYLILLEIFFSIFDPNFPEFNVDFLVASRIDTCELCKLREFIGFFSTIDV